MPDAGGHICGWALQDEEEARSAYKRREQGVKRKGEIESESKKKKKQWMGSDTEVRKESQSMDAVKKKKL